jgi:hypothetical protein
MDALSLLDWKFILDQLSVVFRGEKGVRNFIES